jgi:hypothetical protein
MSSDHKYATDDVQPGKGKLKFRSSSKIALTPANCNTYYNQTGAQDD